MTRPTRDEYYMQIAVVTAARGTCDRAHVGAVLVKDNRIIATGYNGSISGQEHCDDAGHILVDDHCLRTIHAEINALLSCAKHGVSTDGAILYTTHSSCSNCYKALLQAGITEIIVKTRYKDYGQVRDKEKYLSPEGSL